MKARYQFHLLCVFIAYGVFSTVYCFSQGTWKQKANFAGLGREGGVGFSIGAKGYIGTGGTGGQYKDFWEWDPKTDSWTQKADFSGGERTYAIGFSIGLKGYIGTGSKSGSKTKDFWEYDPSANTWVQKSDFGGAARDLAVGFSIGVKGYIGTGIGLSVNYQDFWEWDQATNVWTQKADFMGGTRERAICFSNGVRGYVGTGIGVTGYSKDLWEYDPVANAWAKLADIPGPARSGAAAFSIGNCGYVGIGNNSSLFFKDFYKYDIVNDQWLVQANFAGSARNRASFFSIGFCGYLGLGFDGSVAGKDFYEFSPCGVAGVPAICMVTVDSLSQYNIVAWDKAPFVNADSFIIHREYTTDQYVQVGAVPYDSLSLFVDTVRSKYFPITGDPNMASYRYKLQVRDTCGNYSSLSSYHNTVHMVNNSGNFSWNFYNVENTANPVTFYVLNRDNLNDGNWITVGGVSGTQNSITDPQYSTYASTANWRIETQWAIQCTPTIKHPKPQGTIKTTKSNTFKIVTGVSENNLENLVSIYPNPSSGSFKVEVASTGGGERHLSIYNVMGQLVYGGNFSGTKKEINVDLPKGVYQVRVESEDAVGRKRIIIH